MRAGKHQKRLLIICQGKRLFTRYIVALLFLIFRCILDSIFHYVARGRSPTVLFGTKYWSAFTSRTNTYMEEGISMGHWYWLWNVLSFISFQLFLQRGDSLVLVLFLSLISISITME